MRFRYHFRDHLFYSNGRSRLSKSLYVKDLLSKFSASTPCYLLTGGIRSRGRSNPVSLDSIPKEAQVGYAYGGSSGLELILFTEVW